MKHLSIHLIILTLLTFLSMGIFLFQQNQLDPLSQSFFQNIYLLVFTTIILLSILDCIPRRNSLPAPYWIVFVPIILIRILFIPLIIEVIPIHHIPFVGMIMLVFIGSVLEMEYLRHCRSQTFFARILLSASIGIHLLILTTWMAQVSVISFGSVIILAILAAPMAIYGNLLLNKISSQDIPHQIMTGILYSLGILLLFITTYLGILPTW